MVDLVCEGESGALAASLTPRRVGRGCQLRKPVARLQLYADPDYSTSLQQGHQGHVQTGTRVRALGHAPCTGSRRMAASGFQDSLARRPLLVSRLTDGVK